jgi:flagellar hook-basal body complex protein FliE
MSGEGAQSAGSYKPWHGAALPRLAPPEGVRMDLKLKPFDFAQAAARAGLRPDGQPLARADAAPGTSFQAAMAQALKSVSQAQQDATTLQRELQLDNPSVSLEQTMVAMQKAQLGFQATLQVRNRLVQAYSEIMNMQV